MKYKKDDEDYNIKEELNNDKYLLIIIFSTIIISIIAFPYLPEKMVTHWNFSGEPDCTMKRIYASLLFPVLNIFIYFLMLFTPLIDPKRKNYTKFKKAYRFMRLGIILFMLSLHLIIILYNTGYKIDVGKYVFLLLGLLFILIGRYLPMIKHNYFIGIKIPWTLANANNWKKTHELGGKLYFITGFIMILSLFLSAKLRFWIIIISIVLSTIISIIYSYIVYKNDNKE